MMSYVSRLIAVLFSMQVVAVQASATPEQMTFGEQLSDCSAFFLMLGRANPARAGQMNGMGGAFSIYAQTALNDQKLAVEQTQRSIEKQANFIKELKAADDKAGFEREFTSCISHLRRAEKELRPQLNALEKEIVPVFFN